MSLHFVAGGVQEVCFSESDAAVEKQGIVRCSGCVADGDAACVGESVCRSDDEVFKRVIGMEFYGPGRLGCGGRSESFGGGAELYSDQVACGVLGGLGEGGAAVVV